MKKFLFVLTLALLQACESLVPPRALDTESATRSAEELEAGIASNRALDADAATDGQQSRAEVPPEVLHALVPPPAQPESEERFDLAVKQVPATEFFRGLVRDTGYNMVVHPGVTGEVSLDLKGVTVDEVMHIMRDVYGYDFARDGRLFRVYPDTVRTEIFHLDYLNVERTGTSETQVSAGKVSDSGGSDIAVYDGSTYSGSGNNGGGGQNQVVGTKVNTTGVADFWKELDATLKTIIGDEAGANVVITPQAGLVVVRARPDALRAVHAYLDAAQINLDRQVILEAKIIEVTLNAGFQAGIQWNTFGEDSGGSFNPVVDADDNVIAAGSNNDVAASLLFGGTGDFFNPLASAFTVNASFHDFEAIIDLLETQGTVQVLSSPRIATVNNQKAVIKVGNDEFFVTDISTTTVTAGSAINTQDSPELTPFFSGIALDVTPQISAAGEVTLHIHPTVSQVEQQLKRISGEDVPLAASTIRESDSIVRARNGQIVVIGGLMQNASSDSNAGVPWLGRVPILGYAFKQKEQKSTKSELVILLRPIVTNDQVQTEALEATLERIRALSARLGPQ